MTGKRHNVLPIIDVFAGPGGLGEGFSALVDDDGCHRFRLALSVEKEEIACRTLRMRAIRRYLSRVGKLDCYLDFLREDIDRRGFESIPIVAEAALEAESEVMNAELGKFPDKILDSRIRRALDGATDWVLTGGPPCQAYSLAGRSRRTNDSEFEADEKHLLYKEYLRILREHTPPVFVMENVKGLLSSTHGGTSMFKRILDDLSEPRRGISYEIRSLVTRGAQSDLKPKDFVIESERYGVPQARHRVILLGVRSDIAKRESGLLTEAESLVSVREAIGGLPRIRSRLSRGNDSTEAWHAAVRSASKLLTGWGASRERMVVEGMRAAADEACKLTGSGKSFARKVKSLTGAPKILADWLSVPNLAGVIQHQSREHMASDLARYLFAAAYAKVFDRSPGLADLPEQLLPDHANVRGDGERPPPFSNRFRVQRAKEPSITIMSHMSKDGHYYIHYDPAQCRSLTVREAARLQTFPDDYLFEGNRSEQYTQVGNAVPPLLANKIADCVFDLLCVKT